MSDDYSVSKTNQELLNKSEALKKIVEHNRDYLKLELTLPLGNTALKQVHTNQFLFTKLPVELDLANWTELATALNSNVNRYEGYVENRWYIDSADINVDANGKGEIKLGLNAFASTYNNFTENYRSFSSAYQDRLNSNNNSSSSNSSNNNTSNSVQQNNTGYFPSKAGKNVGSDLNNAVKQITEGCNTEEQKAYCIYDWVDRYVSYSFYYSNRYSSSQVLTGHRANCYDTAFLIYNLCTKAKVRCEIYNGYYHFLDGTYAHLWNKLPHNNKMVFADTGRSGRNPIGQHGKGRYIVSGGSSPYRKNY